jgi:uroporphyrin-III C-methyltransferase
MIPGKVYIVGAGPGHPDLLTLKAAELLQRADVVIFDRLIQEEIVTMANPLAERIYMGKPVGKHDSRQDEINELMVRKAREGKSVVRLKGGDPFLFGRGGEEAEYLAEHEVPFEVIPGISSALAAPLSAGIAVTHRQSASCVTIATGHEATREESRLDWGALARMETLVFLMGVKNAGKIAAKLMESGMAPSTPAAMVQMAYWHDERVVVGTLSTIESDVDRAKVKPPATLIVGEVVRLRDKLGSLTRELQRRPDRSSRFEPAPAPDQLIRLALGGMGSQALGLALERGFFERLEELTPLETLAAETGDDAEALGEILDVLVSMGLIERKGRAYRNLDLASRYLRARSAESLRPALLYLGWQSSSWAGLDRYLRQGRPSFQAPASDPWIKAGCEAFARLAAQTVLERLSLDSRGPVLLLGWGGEAYGEAIAARWPSLGFVCRNPFLETQPREDGLVPAAPGDGQWGTMILSGLLASCDRGQIQGILEEAQRALRPGGQLALLDAFLPSSTLPPAEAVLGTLARHMERGGCQAWSVVRLREVLEGFGFLEVREENLSAGMILVTAAKN